MKLRYLIPFGVIYTVVYVFLAANVVGMEGRGSLVFFAPLSPVLLPWVALLAALFILRDVSARRRKIWFILLMTFHYLLTVYNVLPELTFDSSSKGEAMMRVITLRPWSVYYALGWYLLGHVLIWIAFIRGILKEAVEK